MLEDWAHGVTFDADEIDKERGVILEEWRLGLGAGARMLRPADAGAAQGLALRRRLPIGTPEIIRTFTPDRLKQFYTDWYRPDLMAVIAVGDFDQAAVEALIKTHFARDPGAGVAAAAAELRRARHPGTLYTDRHRPGGDGDDASTCRARCAARDQTTVGAYRQQMVERVFAACCRRASASCRRSRRAVPRRRHQPQPVRARRRGDVADRGGAGTAASRAASPRSSPKPSA